MRKAAGDALQAAKKTLANGQNKLAQQIEEKKKQLAEAQGKGKKRPRNDELMKECEQKGTKGAKAAKVKAPKKKKPNMTILEEIEADEDEDDEAPLKKRKLRKKRMQKRNPGYRF